MEADTSRTDAIVKELRLQALEAAAPHCRAHPLMVALSFAISMLDPDQRQRLGGLLAKLPAASDYGRA
jgi:hypothetical protein